MNNWVGDIPLLDVCTDSFADFKKYRLKGLNQSGHPVLKVKPATVNRALELARTVLNRAARVWRTNGKPWLSAAPLIEMLDGIETRRKPRQITWEEQRRLIAKLPSHIAHKALFAINTGARDENVCGLRWDWEIPVPETGRSVFKVPASEFKGKRDHVLVLNDAAWRIVESQRGKHADFVLVYRRERVEPS